MSVDVFRRPGAELDCTDFFCGIGGSSTGLVNAGWQVKLAANHDQTAINTHSANHPGTEHICADLQTVDYRYLPKTRALWASPICTEVSPAGGKAKRRTDQPSLWEEHGHVPQAAFERTRVTFWEVLRAAEVHRYEVIMLENVLESFDWELLPVFLAGLKTLGYEIQTVNVSAAHVGDEGNDPAAQLRDRVYWVARLASIPAFDLDPRPPAWCDRCDAIVTAVQMWKPLTVKSRQWEGQRAGKYNQQYVWGCPTHGTRCEPLIMPAATAIDWTDIGTRIGDRAELGMRDLALRTMRRIEMGLEMIADPVLIAAAGNTWDAAAGKGGNYLRAVDPYGWPIASEQGTATQGVAMSFTMAHGGRATPYDVTAEPMRTWTTAQTEALAVTEPFVTMLRRNGKPSRVSEPMATFTGGGFHHGLTVPPGAFISKHHGGYADGDPSMNSPVTRPLPTMTARGSRSLVVPFRKGERPHSPGAPFSTLATRQQHGLAVAGAGRISVEDCYFRMLSPREAANGQRFPRDYILTGTLGEQQLGAGNAVACNVAQFIGRRVAEGLDSRSAA